VQLLYGQEAVGAEQDVREWRVLRRSAAAAGKRKWEGTREEGDPTTRLRLLLF
jgi:hypothetical protein